MTAPRVLIAGVGNIFFGDDAFGVEVARRLAGRKQPEGVRVADFGIRGFDLAYALLDDYDLTVLVDATPRGGPPGTLYTLEPDLTDLEGAISEPDAPARTLAGASGSEAFPLCRGNSEPLLETHGMNPVRVLRWVKSLGGQIRALRVVGCEPAILGSDAEPAMGLSEPVAAAVDEAVCLIEELVTETLAVHHERGRR